MNETIVIDLSHWNVVPSDFRPLVDNGIIGVIHKASEGQTVKDRKVDARQHLAKSAGLMFGLYHFITPSDVRKQADNFIEVYRRYNDPSILVALDYERVDVTLDACVAWCDIIESRIGKVPVIYSGHVLKEKLGKSSHPILNEENFPLWLAQYGPKAVLPPGWSTYYLWQYTDKGSIPGVTGAVDLNRGDPEKVRRFWLGTGQPVQPTLPGIEPPPATKVLDFGDAFRRIMDGGKMRRKAWDAGVYIEYSGPTGILTRPFIVARDAYGVTSPWTPGPLDMTTNDWEVHN